MVQDIKYTMPNTKRAMIDYARESLIETLARLPGGNRLTSKQIRNLEDKYENELDSAVTFDEMQDMINRYVEQLRIFAENSDIRNQHWQQTEKTLEELQDAFKQKFDVIYNMEQQTRANVEKIMQEAVGKIEERMAEGTPKKQNVNDTQEKENPESPMLSSLREYVEASDGEPVRVEINGQEVIVTQETIIDPTTNEDKVIYMCKSPKAAEIMSQSEASEGITRIDYDGWMLCITMDEHNRMFPEAARAMDNFMDYVSKQGADIKEQSPFDVLDSIPSEELYSTQTITEETMESITPQNLEESQEPKIIERDGKQYVVTQEAVYGENGELITPGELRTIGASTPEELKKGHVVLNKGTYNIFLTLDEYAEMLKTLDFNKNNTHKREDNEVNM